MAPERRIAQAKDNTSISRDQVQDKKKEKKIPPEAGAKGGMY
jgi:hypothetical protein